jgi:hypothetical protein
VGTDAAILRTALFTPRNSIRTLMLLAAPVAAIVVGVAAEWLDFRALRYPILLAMLAGVATTAAAIEKAPASSLASFSRAVALGALTWGAAESLYAVLHVLGGEPFDADRFGPQWAQALGLVAVHATVLGIPTGVVAGVILRLRAWAIRGAKPAGG